MGSMALSNHYRSEDLLDIETAAGGFQQRKGMKQCLPLTFCFHTGLSQYLALESTEGRARSEIFYHCPVRAPYLFVLSVASATIFVSSLFLNSYDQDLSSRGAIITYVEDVVPDSPPQLEFGQMFGNVIYSNIVCTLCLMECKCAVGSSVYF